MKKCFVWNTILYFILYSISLSFAWFEFGCNFPNVQGIGAIWLFPIVYFLLFCISLCFVFKREITPASYLTVGIITLCFVSVCGMISSLAGLGQQNFQVRDIVYFVVLFLFSLLIFAIYLLAYGKSKQKA